MKMLITDALTDKKSLYDYFGKKFEIIEIKENHCEEYEDLFFSDIDVVICNNLFLYKNISLFKNLKVIHVTSAGLDRLPLKDIKKRKITLFSSRGVYSIPIAEHVILGILSLYHNVEFFLQNKNKKIWLKNRIVLELCEKKVGIIGCGSIGIECARRLQSFGCVVDGFDADDHKKPNFENVYQMSFLKQKINEYDILIAAIPLDETTFHMFDSTFFASMKPQSVFVNVSRGKLVEEESLIEALKTKLFGAVLDVFNEEPLDKNSELWDLNNVFLTPHNSFVGENNNNRLTDLIIKNLSEFFE